MSRRRKSQYSRVGISAVVVKLDNRDTRRADVKVRAEHRIRNTYKAGKECKSEALMRKECHTLVAMLYHLVLSVGYALVAERLDKFVSAVLNTLDSRAVVLVL